MVGRVWPRHRHRGRPLNSVVSWHAMDASGFAWGTLVALGLVVAVGMAITRTSEPELTRVAKFLPGAELFRYRGARIVVAAVALLIAGVGVCGYLGIIG
jgi:hypothetical protein